MLPCEERVLPRPPSSALETSRERCRPRAPRSRARARIHARVCASAREWGACACACGRELAGSRLSRCPCVQVREFDEISRLDQQKTSLLLEVCGSASSPARAYAREHTDTDAHTDQTASCPRSSAPQDTRTHARALPATNVTAEKSTPFFCFAPSAKRLCVVCVEEWKLARSTRLEKCDACGSDSRISPAVSLAAACSLSRQAGVFISRTANRIRIHCACVTSDAAGAAGAALEPNCVSALAPVNCGCTLQALAVKGMPYTFEHTAGESFVDEHASFQVDSPCAHMQGDR
eukprot:6184503-Pleurochrysis_carterae.AAC.1